MTHPQSELEDFLDELRRLRKDRAADAQADSRAWDDVQAVRRPAGYAGRVTAVGGAAQWYREQRTVRERMMSPPWRSIAEMAMEPAVTGLLRRVAMEPAGVLPPTTLDAVHSLTASGMGVAATAAQAWGVINIGGVTSVLEGSSVRARSGEGVAAELERILRATPGTAMATAAVADTVEDVEPDDDPAELFDQIEIRRRRLRLRSGFLSAVILSMAIERLDSLVTDALELDEHKVLVGLVLLGLAMLFVDPVDGDPPDRDPLG